MTVLQNLAISPKDPASTAESVLVSSNAVASAAQRALGLIEIVGLIAFHVERQHFGGNHPAVLQLMHVNRVWRAAAEPVPMSEMNIEEPMASGGHETVLWGNRKVSLELVLRDFKHLFHHTIDVCYHITGGDDAGHFAYGFELLTRCINLRCLKLCDSYMRAWSRLAGKPLVKLPYLQMLFLSGHIARLPHVPIDIASLSNLMDVALILHTVDVDLNSFRRSIDWLGRLFAVCSASLKRVAVRVILAPRSLHLLHLSEVWLTIRPHLEQTTRLSLDFPRLFDSMTTLGPLDDLPDSLEELYLCCQPQNVQPVIERLRDPTYLPNLATVPYIRLQSFYSPPLDRELVKQAIQGLKARKGMKWKKGDKFMDIPMDFDEQAGQGDVE